MDRRSSEDAFLASYTTNHGLYGFQHDSALLAQTQLIDAGWAQQQQQLKQLQQDQPHTPGPFIVQENPSDWLQPRVSPSSETLSRFDADTQRRTVDFLTAQKQSEPLQAIEPVPRARTSRNVRRRVRPEKPHDGPPKPPPKPAALHGQQYPIRASVQNHALGLSRAQDDLEDELTSAARELPQVLVPLLQKNSPSDKPAPTLPFPLGPSSDVIEHCRGVTGIGGSMVPPGGKPKVPAKPKDLPSPASSMANSNSGDKSPANAASPPIKSEPGDAKFKTTFRFVVNQDPKNARHTVRKHVMKEYRRKERWEQERQQNGSDPAGDTPAATPAPDTDQLQTKARRKRKPAKATPDKSSPEADEAESGPSPSASSDSQPASQLVRKRSPADEDDFMRSETVRRLAEIVPDFDHALEELQKAENMPYTADPYAAVAPSEVNPFSRLSLGLGPATQSLLHHFAWVMPSLMDEVVTGTVFNRLGWLYAAVAVHDPTPAHVIVGYTLSHLAGLRGIQEPPEAIEHRNKAVNLIQQRLADPELRISDDAIGSMVNIAGWELITCEPKRFETHMQGLQHAVVARGGITAFNDKQDLQTVLFRLDAIRAYIAQSAPRYPTYACLRTLAPLAINTPPPEPMEKAEETPEGAFCSDALEVVHSLEDTVLLLKSIAATNGARLASNKALISETVRQCLALPEGEQDMASHTRARLLRLAALAFIDAAVQQYFDGDAAPDSGCRRLKARLLGSRHDTSAMASWGRSLEMVIHVLLQADRAMLEKPWRAWYFADALTLTMRLGLDAWAVIEAKLTTYLRDRAVEAAGVVGARSAEAWDVVAEYRHHCERWGIDAGLA